MNAPMPEDTPAIRKTARLNVWLTRAAIAASLLTFLGVVALGVFRFTDSAKQSTTQRGVELVNASAARADCRAEISSVYSGLNDQRDNLGWAALLASAKGDYARVDVLKSELEKVITTIDGLPTRAEAIEKGYTLEGVTRLPCPTLD